MLRTRFQVFAADSGGGTSAAASQAGESGNTAPTAQAATTTPGEPQAGEPQSAKSARNADDYERMIADLRKENATHRTRLKSFEEEERKRQEAQLSEQQKLEKRLADAQAERDNLRLSVQDRLLAKEVRAVAAELGFADPADALGLLPRSELELDDDGEPTNARTLLEKLAKAKPYLMKQQGAARASSSGGATNPSRSTTAGPTTITKDYVAGILSGGNAKWNELSADEQKRVSAFIKGGGLQRR